MGTNKSIELRLRPCPICNDLPLLKLVHIVPLGKETCADYYYACPNCQGMVGRPGRSIESALRKWNYSVRRRAQAHQ